VAILLLIDMFANFYEFLYGQYESREGGIKMALWVRGLDWAAAAAASIALTMYLALIATLPDLITAAFMVTLAFSQGTTATIIYAATAGLTVMAALIKTLVTPGEVLRRQARIDAKEAGLGVDRKPSRQSPYESNVTRGSAALPAGRR
jgi:hypothetical protein